MGPQDEIVNKLNAAHLIVYKGRARPKGGATFFFDNVHNLHKFIKSLIAQLIYHLQVSL
jgi:YHS domain-containing protein